MGNNDTSKQSSVQGSHSSRSMICFDMAHDQSGVAWWKSLRKEEAVSVCSIERTTVGEFVLCFSMLVK